MKGEAGAPGSRAMAWEDGVYFWILLGVGGNDRQSQAKIEAGVAQTNKAASGRGTL